MGNNNNNKNNFYHDNKEGEPNGHKRRISITLGDAIEERKRKLIEKKKFTQEENRQKILDSLLNTYFTRNKERQGRSISELMKDTGCARKTIYNKLHEEGLIKDGFVMKIGSKRGKYYLTSKALKDPTLRAHLFGMNAVKRLLNPTNLKDKFSIEKISKKSKFCNNKIARDIIKRGKHLRKRIMKDNISEFQNQDYEQIQNYIKSQIPKSQLINETALELFEVANRIGLFVTYTLLQALNPEQITDSATPITTTLLNLRNTAATMRDNLSLNWIDNVIRPRQLLMEFIDKGFIRSRLKFQKREERILPVILLTLLTRL